MDPTTIILGIAVALQAAYTAWTQLRGVQHSANSDTHSAVLVKETDMAHLIDKRIQAELTRQDAEISKLKDRVAQLERIEGEYQVAKIYMATHGIPWPPPDVQMNGG